TPSHNIVRDGGTHRPRFQRSNLFVGQRYRARANRRTLGTAPVLVCFRDRTSPKRKGSGAGMPLTTEVAPLRRASAAGALSGPAACGRPDSARVRASRRRGCQARGGADAANRHPNLPTWPGWRHHAVSDTPKINVLVWSEHTAPKELYPNDINAAVADGLRGDPELSVDTAE